MFLGLGAIIEFAKKLLQNIIFVQASQFAIISF